MNKQKKVIKMAKQKGTTHNKYTNQAKYNNTTVVRLDNYQAMCLDEFCYKYSTTQSAIIRLALNRLIKELNEED